MSKKIQNIVRENQKRLAVFKEEYNQITGVGSKIPRRKLAYISTGDVEEYRLPLSMFEDEVVQQLERTGSIPQLVEETGEDVTEIAILTIEQYLINLRLDHDFEFWAITCAVIQDKKTKQKIPFKLNRPQRRFLAKLEEMRLAKKPIRSILLKARQWGGSTLAQMYMGWMQIRIKRSWHSAVIADVEDQAKNIRNMYNTLLNNYPEELGTLTWKPFQGSTKTKVIKERDCIIGIGSAQKPESLRSFDFAMLHLSEAGLWKDTLNRSAADLAQSLQATVPDIAETFVLIESTAKGVGNFFHKQWLNAERGESIYTPVFVPWFEIENYQMEVPDYEKFIKSWGEYEWFLWDLGATIEGIYWYHRTKTGYDYDDWRMMSEYPSTPKEAFQSSDQRVFAPSYVKNAEKTCRPPAFVGEIFPAAKGTESLKDIHFESLGKGNLYLWELPDNTQAVSNRYCVFVDIGGRNEKADYSVVKVFDRYWMMEEGVPEVVAVWHGHLDQDLFAWKAAQIAKFYQNAFLAIEVNSLRKKLSDGDHFLTILDEIADYYDNLYAREDHEKIQVDTPKKYGFHTNKSTKPMIVDALNAALRESGYIERDIRACNEMDAYEIKPDGSYGAVDGEHDDHVIVTAGGVWLSYKMEKPVLLTKEHKSRYQNIGKRKVQSEATI
jgi:hypothetical protein